MSKEDNTIKIDEKDYKVDDLSDDCKAEIQALQFCESEIARLNAKLAITGTARIAYQQAVANLLPEGQEQKISRGTYSLMTCKNA